MSRSIIYAGLILLIAPGAVPAGVADQAAPSLIDRLVRLGEGGNAEALYHLGMAYQTGSGVPVDHRRALAYFERAAAKGDPLAAFKLGCFYQGQDGVVPPDADRALAYNIVAAKAGYALAQQDTAALNLKRGDAQAAAGWLSRAAAQGWPDALMAMATLYGGRLGLPRDPAKVAAYFGLFLRTRTPTAAQQRWLEDLGSKMTADQRLEAARIVAEFKATPTPLTLKALSGQRAAEALAGSR